LKSGSKTVRMNYDGVRTAVTTKMTSMTELSGYALEPIREGADFILLPRPTAGNPSTVLAIAVSAKQPSLRVCDGSSTNTRWRPNSIQPGHYASGAHSYERA